MRILLAALMAVHGFAHLVGFLAYWRLGTFEGVAYKTRLFGGGVDVGDTGIRAIGVLWLLVAVGFEVAAAAVAWHAPWWLGPTTALIVVSLLLSVAGWPDSRIGIPVNVLILGLILARRRFGWL